MLCIRLVLFATGKTRNWRFPKVRVSQLNVTGLMDGPEPSQRPSLTIERFKFKMLKSLQKRRELRGLPQ
jgi:hypothetical protein